MSWELPIPPALKSLISACETVCVAGCCGLDSFELKPASFAKWIEDEGVHAARGALIQLERLIADVSARSGEVSSTRFNAWWPAPACAAYLETWREALESALSGRS